MVVKLGEGVSLHIDITGKMYADYAECRRLAGICGSDGADCGKCSLDVDIYGQALCELPVVTEKLECRDVIDDSIITAYTGSKEEK